MGCYEFVRGVLDKTWVDVRAALVRGWFLSIRMHRTHPCPLRRGIGGQSQCGTVGIGKPEATAAQRIGAVGVGGSCCGQWHLHYVVNG